MLNGLGYDTWPNGWSSWRLIGTGTPGFLPFEQEVVFEALNLSSKTAEDFLSPLGVGVFRLFQLDLRPLIRTA